MVLLFGTSKANTPNCKSAILYSSSNDNSGKLIHSKYSFFAFPSDLGLEDLTVFAGKCFNYSVGFQNQAVSDILLLTMFLTSFFYVIQKAASMASMRLSPSLWIIFIASLTHLVMIVHVIFLQTPWFQNQKALQLNIAH